VGSWVKFCSDGIEPVRGNWFERRAPDSDAAAKRGSAFETIRQGLKVILKQEIVIGSKPISSPRASRSAIFHGLIQDGFEWPAR